MKIRKMLFIVSGHDGNLIRWLSYFIDSVRREGVETHLVDLANTMTIDIDYINNADAVLVYRSFDLKALRLMRRMKADGKLVMFFLDDYLFQPNCKYTGDWKMPMEPLIEADCLVSSSALLLSKMPDRPKILRRTTMDYETMRVLSNPFRRKPNYFGIGLTGGEGRRGFMDRFVYEVLTRTNSGVPEGMKCVFHCFGNREYPQFSNIEIKEYPYVEPKRWRDLYAKWVSFDLGAIINPLDENDVFCHCKSELKFIESGAMGVPLITSRVPPFLDIIKEGENGFFASTTSEYAKKLISLMKDEALSRKVSEACNKCVVEDYEIQKNARQFLVEANELFKKNKKILWMKVD